MEANYSKRELDHYFNDVKSILTKQDETLIRIEEQTTKTNGRVSKLELWRNILIWTFVTVLMPVLFFVLNRLF